jgi:chromosome condensin MukBEF complex kleisin-like MukF subunit
MLNMKQKINKKEIKEQIINLVKKMLDWYRLETKGCQDSLKEAEKVMRKQPSELTLSDCGNLQLDLKFLQERLGDEDNYEKLEELVNKLAK